MTAICLLSLFHIYINIYIKLSFGAVNIFVDFVQK